MQLLLGLAESLRTMPLSLAALCCVLGNLLAFGLALTLGHVLTRVFRQKRVMAPPPPIERYELWLVASCVVLNTLVTIAGLWLWRMDIVRARSEFGPSALLDVLALFFAMDLAMYVLHRVAHHPRLYGLFHAPHHRYTNPRPLTLFALHPFETVAFGLLWLVVVTIYPASIWGIAGYLSLNLGFGLLGHLGVEPLPRGWLNLPVARVLSTSTFHAEHHQDPDHNFGFYTLIWDRIFATLSPDYRQDFTAATAPTVPTR